jgi:rRNA maturation endonuclease Nob1
MQDVLKQVDQIIKGNWAYYISKTPEQQKLSKTRLAICIGCKWFDKDNNTCKLCGCDMRKKTLVEDAKCADNGYEKW